MKRQALSLLASIVAITSSASAKASGGIPIAGPANAPITIEEFSDFECPFCQKGERTMEQVLNAYPGKIRLVFRNMPIPAIHPHALVAAKTFAAVNLQKPAANFAFAKEIFDHQDRLAREGETFLMEVAGKLGLDVDRLKSDMSGAEVAKSLADDKALAEGRGFNGTPSFIVGSGTLTGAYPFTEFKKAIDRQLGH